MCVGGFEGGRGEGEGEWEPPPPFIVYTLMNTLRNFAKSVFVHIFSKFEYFAKIIIYSKSPDHVLLK